MRIGELIGDRMILDIGRSVAALHRVWQDRARLRRIRPELAANRVDGGVTVVVGPLSAETGLGQGARLMLSDLRRRGIASEGCDVMPWMGRQPVGGVGSRSPLPVLPAGPRIVHANPPRLSQVLTALGQANRAGGRLLAYWAWELEAIPASWRHSAAALDGILVPSAFVRDAVLCGLDGRGPPVDVVPHAIDCLPPPDIGPAARRTARGRLGVGEECFVAGCSFAMRSGYRRKNPEAALAAFRQAFPGDGAARLLLHCADPWADRAAWARLCRLAAADPRVMICDAAAANVDIGTYYAALDVHLSLHRSEGFGLTIAEAARAGLPVLATGWQLAPELASLPGVLTIPADLVAVHDPGGRYAQFGRLRWAEPDVAVAAAALRRLRAAGSDRNAA